MAFCLLGILTPLPERPGLDTLRAAEIYHAADERSAAAARYRRAQQAFDEDPLPFFRLAALYQAWGYPERGLTTLEKAASQHSLPDEMERLRLAFLADAGHWDRLTEAAQTYLTHHPESTVALAYLVEAMLHRQQCDAAQSTAQQWHHVAPGDNAAQRTWGALALQDAPTDAAAVICEADVALCAALTGCADPVACDFPLGQTLLRQDEPALAICVLSRAVIADPASGNAHAWLGTALDALDFSEQASAHLERATELNPTSPLGWALLGRHRLRISNYTGAREALRMAHQLDPENPAPTLGMAAALAGESRYEEVQAWIDAALERAPNDPEIYKATARFYLERNLTQAPYPLQAAEGAVALAPRDAEAQMLLGWSHLQSGNPQAALEALDRALVLHPDLAHAHHLRARALQALERHKEADAAFVRAVDLGYRE